MSQIEMCPKCGGKEIGRSADEGGEFVFCRGCGNREMGTVGGEAPRTPDIRRSDHDSEYCSSCKRTIPKGEWLLAVNWNETYREANVCLACLVDAAAMINRELEAVK